MQRCGCLLSPCDESAALVLHHQQAEIAQTSRSGAHWRCKTRATLFVCTLDSLLVAVGEADKGFGEVRRVKDFEVRIK